MISIKDVREVIALTAAARFKKTKKVMTDEDRDRLAEEAAVKIATSILNNIEDVVSRWERSQ